MKKLIVIIAVLLPFICFSQELLFEQEQYPFPVTFYGVEPFIGFHQAYSHYNLDFADIDNDGDFDIIFGASNAQECLFINQGTPGIPDFQFVTNQYVNPGSYSAQCPPTFADIDNDNDLDLFTGFNNGYIVFFRNIGTPDSSVYYLESEHYLNYILENRPSPVFVDIDDDGDLDFFSGDVGSYFDQIYFFRNEGTSDSASFIFVTDNFSGIETERYNSPEFCDLDGDADHDLFIGCEDGRIWYYENTGSADSCNFEYATNYYDSIDVGRV